MYKNKRENWRIKRRTVDGASPYAKQIREAARRKSGARRIAWYKRIRIPGIFIIAGELFAAAAVVLLARLLFQGYQSGQHAQNLLEQAQITAPVEIPAELPMETKEVIEESIQPERTRVLSGTGDYDIIAKLTIPKFELDLPVISEYSDEALEVSVCHFMGPIQPGDAGNVVITGHNYRNGSHFGHIDELNPGDRIMLMDVWGDEFTYEVYELKTVLPDDTASLEVYEGSSALTLVTCENNANRRLLVKCRLLDTA